jgi:hypothetical protein
MVNVRPPDLRAPDAPSVLRKEKQATALLPISTRPRTLLSQGVIATARLAKNQLDMYTRWRLSKVIESGRDCASNSAMMETKVELEDPGCRSRPHSSTARGAGQAVRL